MAADSPFFQPATAPVMSRVQPLVAADSAAAESGPDPLLQHPDLADSSRDTLADTFSKYFYVMRADTPALREEVYRLRYEVYVREFAYEAEEHFADGLERDDYDDHSIHCLLRHRATGLAAGTVRMVCTDPADRSAPLPFERYCLHALRSDQFDPKRVPRHSIGEVSRLAILQHFRRRLTDERKPFSITQEQIKAIDSAEHGRENFPILPVSLFLVSIAMMMYCGVHHGIAMMEPRLARLLRRFGLPAKQVGDVIDYHGPRAPFLLDPEEMFAAVNPDLYKLVLALDQQMSRNAHDS